MLTELLDRFGVFRWFKWHENTQFSNWLKPAFVRNACVRNDLNLALWVLRQWNWTFKEKSTSDMCDNGKS